ncbi:MAG: HDOD domain-containing protein [Gammaproteobacteria bacterium]|nr:HDOD domain-containing protein [Gammaproteobacteria bacterium]
MEIEKKLLTKFLDDINNNRISLPTLPEVAMKVREVVQNPESTAAQISVILGSDPVLSARLLQIANSAMYRPAKPIENLQNAIARLGNTVVRNLITSMVMENIYQGQANSDLNKLLKKLWLHSTKVAAISHVLARKFTKLKPDQAMLGGLIHDIGVIPIYTEAANIPELLADESLLDSIAGKMHILVGTSILDEWNFPQELIAVVAEHEDLERDSGGNTVDYVDIVTVANLHSYLGSQHRLAKHDWSTIPAFKKLGLTPEESIQAMEEAQEEVSLVQKMFMPS